VVAIKQQNIITQIKSCAFKCQKRGRFNWGWIGHNAVPMAWGSNTIEGDHTGVGLGLWIFFYILATREEVFSMYLRISYSTISGDF
jgi:hypothetical protein